MTPRAVVRDFEAHEVAIALFTGLLALGAMITALRFANLDRPAALPEVDRGAATPVRVVPVLDVDSPLLKLGGKKTRAKLPDRWVRQTPKPRVERKAFVSTKAGKTADDVPPEKVEIADAGTEPPPPDAEVALQVDTPIAEVIDAGEPANVDQEGHSDGVAEGTETDPLKARAVDLYRARIASWFSSRFRVTGSGLPQEELVTYRVVATVELTDDRHVAGYTLVSSGNAVFDAAARSMLEAAKGDAIPPPPENYPDTVQRQITLTLICKENRCD